MNNKNNKITYCKLHWKEYGFLDFEIINFYCEEKKVPLYIESLSKYKHYNVVVNEDYLLGPDVSIWDFTVNDLPYIWMWDVETGENTIRAKFTETPDNVENKTLEKIMQDLCDILNMLMLEQNI